MPFSRLMNRRTWLGAAALAAACTGTSAFAQAYPNKPIKIVVPFAAGGATDVLARVLAEKMAVGLGQPLVIDNKPGAAGIIGTDAVAKAAPDGYTLLLGLSNSMLTNQFLYTKLPYSPEKDIAPIYQIAIAPLVLVAHPSVPVATGPELLKYVAANKGKVAYGSYGTGAYPHVAGAYMSLTQNADMSHVAYRGEAPMVQDLLGGQIQFMFLDMSSALAQIKTGKLRALAVAPANRFAGLPDVPTVAEQGYPGFNVHGWYGLFARSGTPAPVMQTLYGEVKKALASAEIRELFQNYGIEAGGMPPEDYTEIVRKDLAMWKRTVDQLQITLQ